LAQTRRAIIPVTVRGPGVADDNVVAQVLFVRVAALGVVEATTAPRRQRHTRGNSPRAIVSAKCGQGVLPHRARGRSRQGRARMRSFPDAVAEEIGAVARIMMRRMIKHGSKYMIAASVTSAAHARTDGNANARPLRQATADITLLQVVCIIGEPFNVINAQCVVELSPAPLTPDLADSFSCLPRIARIHICSGGLSLCHFSAVLAPPATPPLVVAGVVVELLLLVNVNVPERLLVGLLLIGLILILNVAVNVAASSASQGLPP
jgi:hypothetical protein